jgi:hypothetical protein
MGKIKITLKSQSVQLEEMLKIVTTAYDIEGRGEAVANFIPDDKMEIIPLRNSEIEEVIPKENTIYKSKMCRAVPEFVHVRVAGYECKIYYKPVDKEN